jgi:hypothetical protein
MDMLGGLSRTADRDFLVGHYLPALLLVFGTAFLVGYRDALPGTTATAGDVWEFTVEHPLIVAGAVVVVTWMVSATLMAFSGLTIRFLEGYIGKAFLGPLTMLRRREFRNLEKRTGQAEKAIREAWERKEDPSKEDKAEWEAAAKELATCFPAREKWLLPTRFGNTVRSFETYPSDLWT